MDTERAQRIIAKFLRPYVKTWRLRNTPGVLIDLRFLSFCRACYTQTFCDRLCACCRKAKAENPGEWASYYGLCRSCCGQLDGYTLLCANNCCDAPLSEWRPDDHEQEEFYV